ncbi:hypothetical protein DFA_05710 [Cavenderia fasciculata]|uniref:Uncharacterized protein n=1 Tax=Cavenderia fasciculata TaxID=261658 RepID=F4PM77_CACFS|nr:uncharacterized protein DFA_05710 [Cavenderia fasciculata]EGG23577.1 hypothetical protein DFA_05710 [Cavenderia fasciculata]|eukprot:XP_004361428.1 hypothetical protein DFA_05710 [Cavenderia fasciculata]
MTIKSLSFTRLKLKSEDLRLQLDGYQNVKTIIVERCDFDLLDFMLIVSTLCPNLETLDISDNPNI